VEAAVGREDSGDASQSTWLSPNPHQSSSPSGLLQSRDRKMVGDVTGAQAYASTAKCLNICALVFSILTAIVLIILFATSSLVAYKAYEQQMKNHGGF
jgi:hypothetical protein